MIKRPGTGCRGLYVDTCLTVHTDTRTDGQTDRQNETDDGASYEEHLAVSSSCPLASAGWLPSVGFPPIQGLLALEAVSTE